MPVDMGNLLSSKYVLEGTYAEHSVRVCRVEYLVCTLSMYSINLLSRLLFPYSFPHTYLYTSAFYQATYSTLLDKNYFFVGPFRLRWYVAWRTRIVVGQQQVNVSHYIVSYHAPCAVDQWFGSHVSEHITRVGNDLWLSHRLPAHRKYRFPL